MTPEERAKLCIEIACDLQTNEDGAPSWMEKELFAAIVAAIRAAVEAEREACANAIRARSKETP